MLPSNWKWKLTVKSVRAIPDHNIMAGVGYLLMRMANFKYKSVLTSDLKIYKVVVKAGDSVDKIAKTHGSTPEVIKKLNPTSVSE